MTCLQRYGLTACAARILGRWCPLESRPGASSTPSACHLRGRGNIPEVEYGNAGSSVAALVLDCDNPQARAEGLFDLPPPNWIVWRPANDHAHVCWTLAYPVHRYPEARIGPGRYLAHIAEYYAHAVGADPSYAGVLAHNPAPTRETPYETVWGREEPYTLDQLANVISFGWKPPKVRQTGIGRNVALFEAGMQWAGWIGNADRQVITVLMAANQEFTYQLPLSEGGCPGRC